MASDLEYVRFVCGQLEGTGDVRYRKMFGEYLIYVDDKPMVIVCDNRAFVKIHPALEDLMDNAGIDLPYPDAKPHYVLNVQDRALCCAIVSRLLPVTQVPKKKKR